ncbi:membrane protein [Gordonia phage Sapo]|nr:membrane protein [Gordonia phage Sapo]
MNFPTLPENTPGWVVLALFVAFGLKFLFQFLAEASESAAKLFGPLGRRWRSRAQERQAERQNEAPKLLQTVREERDAFARRYRESEKNSQEFLDWYTNCDGPFHRRATLQAAETGCELPPWVPLSQWPQHRKRQREGETEEAQQ